MAIALFSVSHLFAPLAWALRPRSAARSRAATARAPQVRVVPPAAAPCAPARPLRVVRVLEPSHRRSAAGRMVISGRLADVCAELDRLAGLECAAR